MADWDRNRTGGPREDAWRGGRDWQDGDRPARDRDLYRGAPSAVEWPEPEFRPYGRDEAWRRGPGDEARNPRRDGGREDRSSGYGYGDGGDSSYGQAASGSSASALGGYGGADVGGFGQPVQNSQWGQGGYGPLNQGIDYGQDGGRFGPRGYDTGAFGASSGGRTRDEHHAHYQRWRDTQLASHDRDYSSWRDQQARRYDEDYGAWRDERHSTFSKEFEGWRSGRGGQAVPATAGASPAAVETDPSFRPSEVSTYGESGVGVGGGVHGANPALARIADGATVHHHHAHHETHKDGEPNDLSRS